MAAMDGRPPVVPWARVVAALILVQVTTTESTEEMDSAGRSASGGHISAVSTPILSAL